LSQAERRIEVLLRDNQGRPVVNTYTEPTNNDGVAENENGF
jgi:hypothetical protein